ncbi:unnamed protein product, partial [Rotaria magnacalcarata]
KYEIRVAAYSNRGLSSMSNAIEMAIPSFSTQRRADIQQKTSFKNLDDILENISKVQNPTRIIH